MTPSSEARLNQSENYKYRLIEKENRDENSTWTYSHCQGYREARLMAHYSLRNSIINI